MKVCIVAEGCYPYVVGGVSSWINSMIRTFSNLEFVVLAIISDRSQSGRFVYELPENVTEVHEVYLQDFDWQHTKKRGRRTRLTKLQYRALQSLVLNSRIDWDTLFELFHQEDFCIDDFIMGADFLNAATECYKQQYSQIVFSDFLWTLRSMYLPLCFVLKMDVPRADVYHCVATGYAGVLGSMAKHFFGSSLVISEHGIYTREREEELIKADWVAGIYKNIWIDQFKKMSRLGYERADIVTCLYSHARELQIELGCPEDKIEITPNGVNTGRFADLPGKTGEDAETVNIGAVLRVSPIKDVKTMIQAFSFAKKKVPNLKLWIMGPCDEDKEYARECFDMVETLGLEDVVFTGRIDVREYLGKMDFTILTSISEGQPLTILEGFAAKKPAIATDVGNCKELIYGGKNDHFGGAGIVTHIMNLEEIAGAMVELGTNEQLRLKMGENGYNRVMALYTIEEMQSKYQEIYQDFAEWKGLEWREEPFGIERLKGNVKTGK